jgi:hypothetical protein
LHCQVYNTSHGNALTSSIDALARSSISPITVQL